MGSPGIDVSCEAMQVRIRIGLQEGVGCNLERDGHGPEEAKPSPDGGVAQSR